jgi:hypothetical protein
MQADVPVPLQLMTVAAQFARRTAFTGAKAHGGQDHSL